MQRAQSLTAGDVVECRMCQAAARMQGLEPKNIHDFVKMVPMADAEIACLQQERGRLHALGACGLKLAARGPIQQSGAPAALWL